MLPQEIQMPQAAANPWAIACSNSFRLAGSSISACCKASASLSSSVGVLSAFSNPLRLAQDVGPWGAPAGSREGSVVLGIRAAFRQPRPTLLKIGCAVRPQALNSMHESARCSTGRWRAPLWRCAPGCRAGYFLFWCPRILPLVRRLLRLPWLLRLRLLPKLLQLRLGRLLSASVAAGL